MAFVSCICPTMPSRRAWLPIAIESFLSQTHADKELIVIGTGVQDLIPRHDSRIRFRECIGGMNAKRNMAIDVARGSILAHWDDDDWSAPMRLAEEVDRLERTGKAVAGYYTMRFTDGNRWWLYRGIPSYALDTSLCYQRHWWAQHPLRDVRGGEDRGFVDAASSAGQLTSVPSGKLMFATIHAGNSSPRHLTASCFQPVLSNCV